MVNETIIAGISYRCYYKANILVSRDGKRVFKSNNGTGPTELDIKTKTDGERFVSVDGKDYLLKIAIFSCFCHWPNDGKRYEVVYKNGKKDNLYFKNLQLKEIVPYTPTSKPTLPTFATKSRVNLRREGVTVTRDGKVYKGKDELTIVDYAYDPDLDKHFYLGPHVRVGKNRFKVDELMVEAGYVRGKMEKLVSPKVFHKDLNPDNFNSDNLEWISSLDPHYAEYDKAIEAHKKKREIEIDSGKL